MEKSIKDNKSETEILQNIRTAGKMYFIDRNTTK